MTRPTRIHLGPAQRELSARGARRLIVFLLFGVATVGLFLGRGGNSLVMDADAHTTLTASDTQATSAESAR